MVLKEGNSAHCTGKKEKKKGKRRERDGKKHEEYEKGA